MFKWKINKIIVLLKENNLLTLEIYLFTIKISNVDKKKTKDQKKCFFHKIEIGVIMENKYK